jgi:pimeloyl-ACP methyl ester carboxylesterase
MTLVKRLGVAMVILAALAAAVEIAAGATRAGHNRAVRPLGGKLHVTVFGSGPPVVFLHGFRGSGRYWEPHVRALGRDHQIVLVDLLGFGRSPWPRAARYDVREHLEAIHRTIAPIVQGRRAVIVGHSMGAVLAAEYARVYNAEVSQVILLNAPLFRSEAEAKERIRVMSPMAEMFSVRRWWARGSCDLVCALRPVLYRIAPRFEPGIPPDVARDSVLHRWESFDRTLRHVVLESRLEDTLRSLPPMPITIVQGTADRITDRARLEEIARATGATLIFVRGDHNVFLRRPAEVAGHIATHLDRGGPPAPGR